MNTSAIANTLVSILPLTSLFCGLFSMVISLDCIWRTKGSLHRIGWGMLAIAIVFIAVSATDFLAQKTSTIYAIALMALLVLGVFTLCLTMMLYAMIRSIEKGDK